MEDYTRLVIDELMSKFSNVRNGKTSLIISVVNYKNVMFLCLSDKTRYL